MAEARFAGFKNRAETDPDGRRWRRQDDGVELRKRKRDRHIRDRRALADARAKLHATLAPAAAPAPAALPGERPPSPVAWDALPLPPDAPGTPPSERALAAVKTLMLAPDVPDHAVSLLLSSGWVRAIGDAAVLGDASAVCMLKRMAAMPPHVFQMDEAEGHLAVILMDVLDRLPAAEGVCPPHQAYVTGQALAALADLLRGRETVARARSVLGDGRLLPLVAAILGAPRPPGVQYECCRIVQRGMQTCIDDDGAPVFPALEPLLPAVAAVAAVAADAMARLDDDAHAWPVLHAALDALGDYAWIETDPERALIHLGTPYHLVMELDAWMAYDFEHISPIGVALRAVEASMETMRACRMVATAADNTTLATLMRAMQAHPERFTDTTGVRAVNVARMIGAVTPDTAAVAVSGGLIEAMAALWTTSSTVREAVLAATIDLIGMCPDRIGAIETAVFAAGMGARACELLIKNEAAAAAALLLLRAMEADPTALGRLEHRNGAGWMSVVHEKAMIPGQPVVFDRMSQFILDAYEDEL